MADKVSLALSDRFTFATAPVGNDNRLNSWLLKYMAARAGGDQVRAPTITKGNSLEQLESIAKGISQYCWLACKMPETFVADAEAIATRSRAQALIERRLELLAKIDPNIAKGVRQAMLARHFDEPSRHRFNGFDDDDEEPIRGRHGAT